MCLLEETGNRQPEIGAYKPIRFKSVIESKNDYQI